MRKTLFILFSLITNWAYGQIDDTLTLAQALQSKESVPYLRVNAAKEKHLLPQIHQLKDLRWLYISRLEEFPLNLLELKNLEELAIGGTFTSLPDAAYHKWESLTVLKIYAPLTNLPDSFSNIPQLKKLWLNRNQFEEIPLCIFNLQTLRYLEINHNPLVRIPNEIEKLVNLRRLECTNGKIKNIPETLGNLPLLEYFNAEKNQIELFPVSLCNLKKIKIINLDDNNISFIPKEIEKLTTLEALGLVSNLLNDLPDEITELKGTIIDVTSTGVTKEIYDRLSKVAQRDLFLNILY